LVVLNEQQTTQTKYWVEDTLVANSKINFITSTNNGDHGINIEVIEEYDSTDENIIVYSYNNNRQRKKSKSISKKKLNAFVNKKKEVFDDVIEELVTISSVSNIKDRIKQQELDSLIHSEFINLGIDAEYNFGVLDKNENQFIFVKEEKDKQVLKGSQFRAQLFPKDIIAEPNFLFVSFPNQREYVIKSMSATLGLSIGFILLIIFIFYKTVKMLIKQKKITDIKNDLINNITHEFKTPLATISLACEAMNEPQLLTNSNSALRYSKIINDENSRLRNLVENLLNAAALENGKIELDKQVVDVHEVISDVVSKFQLLLENQNGNFRLEFSADKYSINADPFHLSIIFNNIIDNALKYNELEPEIIISTENSDNGIIVKFSDNGIGIKKSELKNIFETFYRVPTGNIQNVQGSGMGLHHVKKLAIANGGEISVSSIFGSGTVFTVEFSNE